MAFAITQTCCTDASCVSVCPVNCIHPTPDEPGFGATSMLYIDPQTCIDCGACADVCPVDAISPVDQLADAQAEYAEINARYYRDHPTDHAWSAPQFPRTLPAHAGGLRVAIVGTGPAASYAAQSLLRTTDAEVTVIDRLPVPGGLARFGVAPDHPSTKKINDSFASVYQHPRLRVHLNVEVGRDLSHADIAAHHHAVIYAVGAAADRALDLPGENLPGSIFATRFVGWYNAHPDIPPDAVDLSAERAVIVGNGNVALDVARILLTDPDQLAHTDIADHALQRLRTSNVREVVLLGRRGPEHTAATPPEVRALTHLPGVRLIVDDHPQVRETITRSGPGAPAALLADVAFEAVTWHAPPPQGKRIVFRFLTSPAALLGDDQVQGLRVHDTAGGGPGEPDTIAAGLVVRAIGYRPTPIADLPFDEATATVHHQDGRVLDPDSGEHLPGTYVTGWIKRGPSGGIGANRTDAAQTVDALLDDAAAHRLPTPTGTAAQFTRLVRRRQPDAIGRREMQAIDRAERRRGQDTGRPRAKFATIPELLAAGKRLPRR